MVLNLLAVASFFATVNERLYEVAQEYLPEGVRKYNRLISLATGTIMGLAFGIDFISPVLETANIVPNIPATGLIVSGFLIGAGSNLLHGIFLLLENLGAVFDKKT